MQYFQTTITTITPLAPGKIEMTVEMVEPAEIKFLAGQFMQFMLAPDVVRAYSIVSVPAESNKTLTFCIGLIDGGVGSKIIAEKKVGDELVMRGSLGVFTVKDFTQNLCFVATGVGVAPFASMIPDALMRGSTQKISLLFGVRKEEDIFYHQKFQDLAERYPNFSFIPTLSRHEAGWSGQTGRVTSYIIERYPEYNDCQFFICGSMEMIKEVRQLLLDKGHDPKKIKLEIFT